MPMKNRFRLIYRSDRGGKFYCVDSKTGQRSSLKTKDRDAAEQLVLAKNQSLRQPIPCAVAPFHPQGSALGRDWFQVWPEVPKDLRA